jgi:hypothetical protein
LGGPAAAAPALVGTASVAEAVHPRNETCLEEDRGRTSREPLMLSPALRWEMDEELRHVERLLQAQHRTAAGESLSLEDLLCEPLPSRFQQPPPVDRPVERAMPRALERPLRMALDRPVVAVAAAADHSSSPPARAAPLLDWIRAVALYAGAMAITCGAALVIGSRAGGNPDLWKIGLPGGIAGLGGLLVALAYGGRRDSSTAGVDDADSRVESLSSSGSTTRLPASPPSMARHISAPK